MVSPVLDICGTVLPFTLDNSHQDMQDESFIRIRHQYLFMHFMMGGLMLYEKKYDWLKLMLTFTQTMPWSYPLVPGSFPAIWDMLREAYMKESLPWGLANDFLFVGLTTDVSVDAQIYKKCRALCSVATDAVAFPSRISGKR